MSSTAQSARRWSRGEACITRAVGLVDGNKSQARQRRCTKDASGLWWPSAAQSNTTWNGENCRWSNGLRVSGEREGAPAAALGVAAESPDVALEEGEAAPGRCARSLLLRRGVGGETERRNKGERAISVVTWGESENRSGVDERGMQGR